jgi:predicted transcriptional regulator
MFERASEYFREFWESLADEERNILRRLARDEHLDDETDGILQRLMRKEIIERDNGLCRFQVPLMKRNVASRIEIELQ